MESNAKTSHMENEGQGQIPPQNVSVSPIKMRDLIEAGLHYGHQTRRWNPKMRAYIYGVRNSIHIIDLQQTIKLFRRAYNFVSETVGRGGHVLFVGTKRLAQEIVETEAQRSQMFYVVYRWIGGTLTNFKTISRSLNRLKELDGRFAEEDGFAELKKKEVMRLKKEKARLEKYFGGIKSMKELPSIVFVIDPGHEATAVREANKVGIPVVALVDTNCDPDSIDYIIPGNDDAIKSIHYVTSKIADACVEGLQRRMEVMGGTAMRMEHAGLEEGRQIKGPEVEYTQRKV